MADWRELLDHSELFADKGDDVADLSFSPIDIIASADEEALEYYQPQVGTVTEDEADLVVEGDGFQASSEEGFDESTDTNDWQAFTVAEDKTTTANLTPSPKEALNGPNAAHWKEAIRKEIDGLQAMGTWEVVDPPEGVRLVDSKLVLRIKTDSNGVPIKYKARLVARGFTQQEGIDFEETFSPVAPYTAIRTILALAAANKWHLHCTDFTQAYLNGTLDHIVYMKPPNGVGTPPNKVFKIVKGLYGLKQSGRVWNQHLDKLLRELGFMPLSSTPCVYQRGRGDQQVVLVTYVDDIILTSPSLGQLENVKAAFATRFKLEDKGHIDSLDRKSVV